MQRLTLALIATASLTGCNAVTSSAVCPTLFVYSAEQQEAAAQELAALPEGSVLAVMIGDYGVNRAEARACEGQ